MSRILTKILIAAAFIVGFSAVPSSPSHAQSECYVEANLPHTGTGGTGTFGHERNSSKSNSAGPGKRYHKGFDANIAVNKNIAGPTILFGGAQGQARACDIKKPAASENGHANPKGVPYGALNPTPGQEWIYRTQSGYGYFMVFDCSPLLNNGKEMLVRYAHLAGKHGSTGNPTPVLTGRTDIKSSAPHVHVEFSFDGTLVDPQCLWGQMNHHKGCPVAGRPNICGADWETMKQNCPEVKMRVNSQKNCQSIIPGSGTNTAVGDASNTQADTAHNPSDMNESGSDTGFGDGDVPAGPINGAPGYNPPTGGGAGNPNPPVTGEGGGSNADVTEGDGAGGGTGGDGNAGAGGGSGTDGGGSPDLVPTPDTPPEKLSGCGTDTWTAMVNQSVMQTRREDILNKRYIVKPDSVLDYSCFDSYIKKTAQFAGSLFSETANWANATVPLIGKEVIIKRELGNKSLDNALMDVVQSAAKSYRNGQFNNEFLADSANVAPKAGMTNCDVMANVWKAAKCKNFDDVDAFYTFEDLKSKDPREFPTNMRCN